MRVSGAAMLLAVMCEAIGCSSSQPKAAVDHLPDGGGQVDGPGTGGASDARTGGTTGTGGAAAPGTGGAAVQGSGGATSAGGVTVVATGGAAGDATATGGAGTAGRGADAGGGADAGAMDAGPDGASADMTSTDPGGWPAVSDYSAAGPFAATRETNIGPGGVYDLFRPSDLAADHRLHPIISWANGTLYSVDDYAPLLSHWASFGFVVIANHTNTTAGGATHKAGIDWLVAQNAAATSPYFGLLDVTKIGAAGHSQGGAATIAAGANKPGTTGITVTLPLMPLLSFETDKTIVAHQVVPMFNINASMDNRDPTGMYATQIYGGAVTELVQASFIGVHEDAMGPKMHAPTAAWFRWKLMGDAQAKAFFYPMGTCGLCKDADWMTVRYKNPAP